MNTGITPLRVQILELLGPRAGATELYGAEFVDHGFEYVPYAALHALRQEGLLDYYTLRGTGHKVFYFLSWYGEACLRKWKKFQELRREAQDWVSSVQEELRILEINPSKKFAPVESGDYHKQLNTVFQTPDPTPTKPKIKFPPGATKVLPVPVRYKKKSGAKTPNRTNGKKKSPTKR